ncbi:hypothetical protein WJS89_00520 [Sphingomicrobium sp. XHP0235]
MTNEDQIRDTIQRILKPQTDADRLLMWTAISAFVLGALIF